jgi:pimeloyl-ACP methyl ester carboxylesterase
VLVYHLNQRVDAALKAAAGSNAFVANDTVPQAQAVPYYSTIPPISRTIQQLAPPGVNFSPVILCGFSAGGWATRTILQQGGDPDALVIADGTYGTTPSDWAAWSAYAARARSGERTFLTSYTTLLVASSTWHVLCAITGQTLPLGPIAGRPAGVPMLASPGSVVYESGRFKVFGYGSGHEQQGDVVLPMMLSQVTGASRFTFWEKALVGAAVATVLAAGVALAWDQGWIGHRRLA